MKQLVIVNSTALISSGSPADISGLALGTLGIYHSDDTSTWLSGSAAATKNFNIVAGRGANVVPAVMEVNFKTLKVTKTSYAAHVNRVKKITFTKIDAKKEYTIIVVKKSTVPHERNTYTTVFVSKTGAASADAATVFNPILDKLVEAINAKKTGSHVVASHTAGNKYITLTATDNETDFEVYITDAADTDATLEESTPLTEGSGTVAWLTRLAEECAADKGFIYLAEDGKELYPGFPETIAQSAYDVYNLRFANAREFGKTGEDPVYQVVHIAIPHGNDYNTLAGKLDVLFGLSQPAAQSGGSGSGQS